MATRLIFGCGYVGLRAARRWHGAGDRVFAVTRSSVRAESWAAEGLAPLVADVTDPETLKDLPAADTVLYAVGYDRTAEPSIDDVYAGGMRNVLAALPGETGRLIYVSSTGVYGDAGGGWVDESTPADPQRAGGKASLAAEQAVGESCFAEQSAVLRLAGIYGPDRLPYVAALRGGEPIAAPQDGWLNLIHVEDAVAAILQGADAREPWGLVCVSDGAPPQRRDYYAEAARLLDAPPPRFTAPAPGSPRAARAAADKRIGNDRLLAKLAAGLKHPDYREGLAAILTPPG